MFGLKSEILRAVDEYGIIAPSKGKYNLHSGTIQSIYMTIQYVFYMIIQPMT